MDFLRRDRDFCLSESRGSRRERDFFFQNLMFREGNENYKMKSHGRARKNEANSRENSRDRKFSLVSGLVMQGLSENLQCDFELISAAGANCRAWPTEAICGGL